MGIQKDIIEAEVRLQGMSAVQKQLVELSSGIGELTEKNKRLRIAQLEEEAAGRKGSEAWKALRAEIKANNTEIQKAEAKMNILTSQMKVSEMTGKQLTKTYRDLEKQLSRTSKELQPDKWNELNGKMKEVELQMGKTSQGTSMTQKMFGGLKDMLPTLGFAAVVAGIGKLVGGLWDLSKVMAGDSVRSSVVLGDQIGYVEDQASKLADTMGFTKREFVAATAATADLLVPLGFGREAAANMSVETQKLSGALNEWTGGRYGAAEISMRLQKAMLGETESLKEVGISVKLDSKEYKDLVKVKMQTNKVTEDQARAMAMLDLLYAKSTDAQTAYANGGNKLLRFQQSITTGWRRMKEVIVEYFTMTADERLIKEAKALKAQGQESEAAGQKIKQMADRYDELSKKGNLSKAEQKELNGLIKQLGDYAPGAITAINDYGEAMGINTTKIREAAEAQRLLNIEKNKDMTDNLTNSLSDKIEQLNLAAAAMRKTNVSLNTTDYDKEAADMATRNINPYSTGGSTRKTGAELKKGEEEAFIRYKSQVSETTTEVAKLVLTLKEMGFSNDEIAKKTGVKWDWLQEKVDRYTSSLGATDDGGGGGKKPVVGGDDKKKKIYSLSDDEAYQSDLLALKNKVRSGDISSEEEYQAQLLALEIKYLQARLTANVETGKDKLDLQNQLADKQIEQKKNEARALEEAQKRMTKADLDAMEAYFSEKDRQYNEEASAMQARHKAELTALGNNKDEKERVQIIQNNEEKELARQHLLEIAALIQQLGSSGALPDLKLADKILSPEELADLKKRLEAAKDALSKVSPNEDPEALKAAKAAEAVDAKIKKDEQMDLLGFTVKDWQEFEANLKNGTLGIQEMQMAVQTLMSVWETYSNLMTAIQNKQMKAFEKNINKEKNDLKNKLDHKVISEAAYNKKTEALDKELQDKKDDLEYKQAKREKALAIMGAIMNTAMGITAAFKLGPILGLVMAGIVGAMGAAQIATIMATPIPGREKGGMLVQREQDGKYFDAEFQPRKRGFVGKPTVIVGESGNEFVANNDAVNNPTIAPILNLIDSAQRDGSIAALDLNRIMAERIGGRVSGGTISGSEVAQPYYRTNEEVVNALKENAEVNRSLIKGIKNIKAVVSMTGRDGLKEKTKAYDKWTEDVNL